MTLGARRGRRLLGATLVVALFAAFGGQAAAAPATGALPQMWAIEVDAGTLRHLDRVTLRRLEARAATLVAMPGKLRPRQQSRLRRLARRASLPLLEPMSVGAAAEAGRADVEALASACSRLRRAGRTGLCAIGVGSPGGAGALAAHSIADIVVVRLGSARRFVRLARSAPATRLLGIVDVSRRSLKSGRWRKALAVARRSELLDLAARPGGSRSRRLLKRLPSQGAQSLPRDHRSPTAPGAPLLLGPSLRWSPSTDEGGLAGYAVYVDGVEAGTTAVPSYPLPAVDCASHEIGVDAFDRAGNRSARSVVTKPSTCAASQPPAQSGPAVTSGAAPPARTRPPEPRLPLPPLPCVIGCPDTTPPTGPGDLRSTAATATTVALDWSASRDDKGVAGYRVYRGGTAIATTSSTAHTSSGLSCGRSYSFGVEAFDAAANTSARAIVAASTAACPAQADTAPPSVPTGMAFAGRTQTSVSLKWNAATDNRAVAGYHLYRNGRRVASTAALTYTFSGLTCDTPYAFGLEAYDAAGNRSNVAEASGTTSTLACGGPEPEPEPEPGPSGSANLWVDGSGGSCRREAAPTAYSDPAACTSLAAAYAAASPGDSVRIKGGTYPAESIPKDPAKVSTADIVFAPAAGESVTVSGESRIYAAHITFRDLKLQEWDVEPGAADLTFDDIDSDTFDIYGSGVTILGGDYGPVKDDYPMIASASEGSEDPTDIVIDGALFHDFSRSPGRHMECLHVASVDGFVLRNSRFRGCAVFDVFFTVNKNGAVPRNLTIENNWFGPSVDGGAYSVAFDGDCPASSAAECSASGRSADYSSVVFRHNSLGQKLSVDTGEGNTLSGFVVRGNVGDTAGCHPQATYQLNVWTSTSCGGSDTRVAGEGFIDKAGFDYHLTATSPAVDAVTTGCPPPSEDIDGEARPRAGACDAGADESPHTAPVDTGGGDGGGAQVGHLWVSKTAGTTPTRCASPCEYDPAKAYRSFDAAYDAATGGDRIVVKAADYGHQSITGTATSEVTITCQDGARINVGSNIDQGLTVNATNLTIDGCPVHGSYAETQFNGVDVTWRNAYLMVPNVVSGPWDCDNFHPITVSGGMDGLLIENMDFWPYSLNEADTRCSSNGPHREYVRLDSRAGGEGAVPGDTHNIRFTRNRWHDGAEDSTAQFFITSLGTVDPYDVTIDNNYFGRPSSSAKSIAFHGGVDDCRGFVIAYNTWKKPALMQANGACTQVTDVKWIGNLGPKNSVSSCGGTYIRNVWQHSTDPRCPGSSDTFVSGAGYGYDALGFDNNGQLSPASPAVDAGEASWASDYCTGGLGSVDMDGNLRQVGAACDAGADEYAR